MDLSKATQRASGRTRVRTWVFWFLDPHILHLAPWALAVSVSSIRVSPSVYLSVCLFLFPTVIVPAPSNFCSLLNLLFLLYHGLEHQTSTLYESCYRRRGKSVCVCRTQAFSLLKTWALVHGHWGDTACSGALSLPSSFLALFQVVDGNYDAHRVCPFVARILKSKPSWECTVLQWS